jgi:hypothetical protein
MHGLRKHLGGHKRLNKVKETPASSCRECIEERVLKLMDLMHGISKRGDTYLRTLLAAELRARAMRCESADFIGARSGGIGCDKAGYTAATHPADVGTHETLAQTGRVHIQPVQLFGQEIGTEARSGAYHGARVF